MKQLFADIADMIYETNFKIMKKTQIELFFGEHYYLEFAWVFWLDITDGLIHQVA